MGLIAFVWVRINVRKISLSEFRILCENFKVRKLKTLINKAKLIPKLHFKKTKQIIGKNTVSAVRSGFFWGYIGLVNNIINLIKKETRKNFKVIITGGFSNLFFRKLNTKAVINRDITIKGLIKVIKLYKF